MIRFEQLNMHKTGIVGMIGKRKKGRQECKNEGN